MTRKELEERKIAEATMTKLIQKMHEADVILDEISEELMRLPMLNIHNEDLKKMWRNQRNMYKALVSPYIFDGQMLELRQMMEEEDKEILIDIQANEFLAGATK